MSESIESPPPSDPEIRRLLFDCVEKRRITGGGIRTDASFDRKELLGLLDRLVNDLITPGEHQRLERILARDAAARQVSDLGVASPTARHTRFFLGRRWNRANSRCGVATGS